MINVAGIFFIIAGLFGLLAIFAASMALIYGGFRWR